MAKKVSSSSITKSLDAQKKLADQYLAFAKDQFTISTERQADIDANAKATSTFFNDIATEDREYYETTFRPIEKKFAEDAMGWDSPERLEAAAAKAGADVRGEAARQQEAMTRNQFSMGVNPNSGRYAGLEKAYGLGTALGSVDAQNKAMDARRAEAVDLRQRAIALGQDTNAGATSAAGQSDDALLAASGVANELTRTVGGAYETALNTYGDRTTGLTNVYNTQTQDANADANRAAELSLAEQQRKDKSAAGWGDLAGTVIGAGLSFLSDKDAKTNRKKVPKGKGLEAVEQMPVDSYNYKPGEGDGGAHVGPMAEDFASATGKGDGKRINVQDAIGVTMAAVKDLSAKVDRLAEAIGLGQTAKA